MKEKLWNANYIKVMTTNFLLYFAFYLLTPLLPLYLSENFGATKDVIGIVLSGYTVAALIIRPFSGYVVDSFSRKKVLMVCLSAFAIFFAGYIAASTILMFAICRTLHGGPFGAVTVANSTCAIDVLPASRRNEGIGLYGLSNNFAMAIAPSIGIYLHNAVDSYMILFWIAFIVAIASVVIAGTIRLPEKEIVKNKEKLSRPLLPDACLAPCHQHRHVRFLLGRSEQLSCDLQQGGTRNYGRNGHLFCPSFHGPVPVKIAGKKSLEPGKTYPECGRRNAAFACWFHHLCCRQAPGSLLSFGLSHRPGQRSSLPSLPQHVY